jgi:transposase-like protein
MHQSHCSTTDQRVHMVSELIAGAGKYGLVSSMSSDHGVSRQTLYSWKRKGEEALRGTFRSKEQAIDEPERLERAVLILLTECHASYRGIQVCLQSLLGLDVSLGKITAIVQEAGKRAQRWLSRQIPQGKRALALDEQYGSQRGEAYLNVVDVHSGLVLESRAPVAVDAESWIILLWQMQEQGLEWKTIVSDGGRAIQEAVQEVTPENVHQRDVWHVEHECQKVQVRLDRQVTSLEQQAKTVARQAERIARGEKPRGAHPHSDVQAHERQLVQARYVADSLHYLTKELKRLLEVVVLAPSPHLGVLSSKQRDQELEALLALLAELWQTAPVALQADLKKLWHHVQLALPHLVAFTQALDSVQQEACRSLGPQAVSLIAWAWQRRAVLGPKASQLLADLPQSWQESAATLLSAWDQAVRASSVVENWHSVLRPFLAVHRSLSAGLLAILAVWHNHRVAARGLHRGHSPLMRSGLQMQGTDWLLALGYPPVSPLPVLERLVSVKHQQERLAA